MKKRILFLVFVMLSVAIYAQDKVKVELDSELKLELKLNGTGELMFDVHNPGNNLFIGRNVGLNNLFNVFGDQSQFNTALGYESFVHNTYGAANTAVGDRTLHENLDGVLNSAFGSRALLNNTSGSYNTAIGTATLFSNLSGNFNTALGNWTLLNNTTGNHNLAIGTSSMRTNTVGSRNVAIGDSSLYSSEVSDLVAVGHGALKHNTSGIENTALGNRALYSNISGKENTAIGMRAMFSNTSGYGNVALGTRALDANIDGYQNSAIGFGALYENVNGHSNVAVGTGSLSSNTDGNGNTGIGFITLRDNTSGVNNTAIGSYALWKNREGTHNTAVGFAASYSNFNGNRNVSLGNNTLYSNVSGNGNVAIGDSSGYYETGSNKLYISNSSAGQEEALIYGDFASNILRINNQIGVGRMPASEYALTLKTKSTGIGSILKIYDAEDSETWHLRLQSDNDLGFSESGVSDNVLVLEKGGNIGIGTSDPEQNLHIRSGSDPTLKLQSDGTSEISGRVSMRQSNNTGMDIYYDGVGDELVMEGFLSGVSQGRHIEVDHATGYMKLNNVPDVTSDYEQLVRKSDGTLGIKPKYEIGDEAHGGIIFWLDESGEHGLVAADYNLSSHPWTPSTATLQTTLAHRGNTAQGSYPTSNFSVGGFYGGERNTQMILSQGAQTNAAFAAISYDLTAGVQYSDWYLPCVGEYYLLYLNLISQGIGNYTTQEYYWTSNEYDANQAILVIFDQSTFIADIGAKSSSCRVIPIRRF